MSQIIESFDNLITSAQALAVVRAAVMLLVGLVVARLLGNWLHRISAPALGSASAIAVRRAVFWGLSGLFVIAALHQLGFNLGILLGAAGVLSVAVAFASQTSASNLVSGIFLIAERPFDLHDVIRVGSTTGEVLSIDLLSVKLRTFDNLYVRIPNETLIKSEVTTLTRFAIRRLDLSIGVAYRERIGRVRDALVEVADAFPLCLDDPRPMVIFKGFGESSLDLQFSVWTRRENYRELLETLPERIKERFDADGIEIPFPQRTLYAGADSPPLRVSLIDEKPSETAADTAHPRG